MKVWHTEGQRFRNNVLETHVTWTDCAAWVQTEHTSECHSF